MTTLGTKTHAGASIWPPADTLVLKGGALLKHTGEWMQLGPGSYRLTIGTGSVHCCT